MKLFEDIDKLVNKRENGVDLTIYHASLEQWFITLLEELNPTSSIHVIIEPFRSWKNKM